MHFRKYARNCALILAAAFFMFLPASAIGAERTAWPVTGTEQRPTEVVPIGRTAGMKLFADGVIVIELSTLNTAQGGRSPAKQCGLQPGDIILQLDGVKIDSVITLQDQLEHVGERQVPVLVRREAKAVLLSITPVRDQTDNVCKIGAWVRDSMAGIGTITYFDPATGLFGALGHGIHDGETGVLMPIGSGSLLPSTVAGVRKGEIGRPGELIGMFDLKSETGSLLLNDETGLYGRVDSHKLYPELMRAEPIPVGTRQEVVVGKAEILSNVEGGAVKSYQIEIIKIIDLDRSTKNMQIRVTDPVLLALTGGIVQGMSGSPILQNGKLIGAVTHVLVGDPTSGYGILIENMLDTAQGLAASGQAA